MERLFTTLLVFVSLTTISSKATTTSGMRARPQTITASTTTPTRKIDPNWPDGRPDDYHPETCGHMSQQEQEFEPHISMWQWGRNGYGEMVKEKTLLCPAEADVRSFDKGQATRLFFNNTLGKPVDLYWVTYEGGEMKIGSIGAKDQSSFTASEGHLFHIRSRNRQALLVRHRVGYFDLSNPRAVPCGEQPLIQAETRQTNKKTSPPKCGFMNKGFVNNVGCPINLFYFNGTGEELVAQFGTEEIPEGKEYDYTWNTPVHYEATYQSLRYIVRMANGRFIREFRVGFVEIAKCPNKERTKMQQIRSKHQLTFKGVNQKLLRAAGYKCDPVIDVCDLHAALVYDPPEFINAPEDEEEEEIDDGEWDEDEDEDDVYADGFEVDFVPTCGKVTEGGGAFDGCPGSMVYDSSAESTTNPMHENCCKDPCSSDSDCMKQGEGCLKGFCSESWTWDNILKSRQPIIANGNIWPPHPTESANDCLTLVTRNQIMRHCIDIEENFENSYNRTTLHRGNPGKYRGAFMSPGSDDRRMWLLNSPPLDRDGQDELQELDTVTGEILQSLTIDGCIDGHDVVRVNDTVFIVGTRHGHVFEVALPALSHPYAESSIAAGAMLTETEGHVDVIKRHTGFTRGDHINNVAVHPQLLISNLHGGRTSTRLSALDRRSISEDQGRELNLELDGFKSVQNVGNMCHGIAFWEDTSTSQIKLISLDSASGTMVSVVLSGPNPGLREVLWTPDDNHPVLVPPKGSAAYKNGAKLFSKGLAVQGGVAYFGVSYARSPPLRSTIPESLLVAVNLATKKELWARTVRSNGIINQILTKSNLGEVQIPPDISSRGISSIKLTLHGGATTQIVDVCEDLVRKGKGDDVELCKLASKNSNLCHANEARRLCCACNGGTRHTSPLMAEENKTLDTQVMRIQERAKVTATATFVPHRQCLDANGHTKRLPLYTKTDEYSATISSVRDLEDIITHLCNLNVEPLQERVLALGVEGFTAESQQKMGNAFLLAPAQVTQHIKKGVQTLMLMFCSKRVDKIYHFPWLNEWLPMIEELVLGPLGISLNQIIRMQLASIPVGANINFHKDKNEWSKSSHRVHVPIITHSDLFFIARTNPANKHEDQQALRIKSNVGEAYEFNNALQHAVYNRGSRRVHLIIDWEEEKSDVDSVIVKVRPGEVCIYPGNELQCSLPEAKIVGMAENVREGLNAKVEL